MINPTDKAMLENDRMATDDMRSVSVSLHKLDLQKVENSHGVRGAEKRQSQIPAEVEQHRPKIVHSSQSPKSIKTSLETA
jgi:hypothetical protein